MNLGLNISDFKVERSVIGMLLNVKEHLIMRSYPAPLSLHLL